MKLTSLEAIVEAHWHLEVTNAGWTLWVRHRHLAGLMTDCPAEEYTGLSRGEAIDVAVTLLELYGPLGAPR
jgi:hypothetical protein